MVILGPVSFPAESPLPPVEHRASLLAFETLISDTSASLFAESWDLIDDAIERALGRVRMFFEADRCVLMSVSADGTMVTATAESGAEGVPRLPANVNLVELFPWAAHTLFVERVPVRVASRETMPAEARIDRQSLTELGIHAALVLPVESDGVVTHLIVLNVLGRDRDWPEALVTRLRVLGEMVVAALRRQASFMAMLEAEERASLAVAAAEAGLWTLDYATGTFWASERARAIFGYSHDQSIDMAHFEQSVHRDDWPRVRDAVDRSERRLEPLDVEYRILHADGHLRWISSRGRPLAAARGGPAHLTGISIDITARRQAEDASQLNAARLQAAVDLAALAFFEADWSQGTVFVDDRFRDLCGVPPDLTGPPILAFWREHLHPDDAPWVLEARRRGHSGEQAEVDAEYRYRHPTRGERWIRQIGRARVRDAAGTLVKSFTVLRDVTERRRAEEELRRSYAEIEQLKDRLQAESDYLKVEIGSSSQSQREITGQSRCIQKVLRQIEQVAAANSSVLVLGETGTGKERIAQAIHRLSPRHGHVMVRVNCAALPSGLIESELFGREKGAFTGALSRQVGRFEIADRSTLFLDEIGELPLELQAKLLRVLEAGEFERLGSPRTIKVDVRVIAATNRDLLQAIREGRFREDLYYRLNVFPIRVPALRDRVEDIPALVWAILGELNVRMGRQITQVPRKTMEALQRRQWLGNVRELRNVLEHAVIISTGHTLSTQLVEDAERPAALTSQALADVEREHILSVLRQAGGRVTGPNGAAEILGLNRGTLYGRMRKLGIPLPKAKSKSSGS